MAAGQLPGPHGVCPGNGAGLDDGTLPRSYGQFPGPICLYGRPNRLYTKGDGAKSGTTATTARKKLGIHVHEKSSISAADWVTKIKACDDVPEYFQKQILSSDKDRLIYVTDAKHFKFPTDVIAKDWLNDWLSAFIKDEWELTTGILEVAVDKPKDPKSKDPKLAAATIVGSVKPDLSDGETIEGFTAWAALGERGTSTADFRVEFGSTVPDGIALASGRKTIVVTTQAKMILGGRPGKTFTVTDNELVNTWFHEIACHAGRVTAGKDSAHGNAEVESTSSDIDRMIPERQTAEKIFNEIQGFLGPSKTSAP
ncbi:MAG TPA: hypothetical protein VL346_10125 [Acidobacteriaceae bacterium]|nr:hypothetical protein [Acidobacteriaceae bacterium]